MPIARIATEAGSGVGLLCPLVSDGVDELVDTTGTTGDALEISIQPSVTVGIVGPARPVVGKLDGDDGLSNTKANFPDLKPVVSIVITARSSGLVAVPSVTEPLAVMVAVS